jgi:hypothetical protein
MIVDYKCISLQISDKGDTYSGLRSGNAFKIDADTLIKAS